MRAKVFSIVICGVFVYLGIVLINVTSDDIISAEMAVERIARSEYIARVFMDYVLMVIGIAMFVLGFAFGIYKIRK